MSTREPYSISLTSKTLPELGSFGVFIGRGRQLEEVDERLLANRLVTLVGPGGMGKTRLAYELIKSKTEDPEHFTEIAFVSFELVADNSEAAVLDTLVFGLSLIPEVEGDLRASLVKRLRDSPVLLVLDNCETAHSSIATLVRYLLGECPKLKILATSQHHLGLHPFEAVYELPPLSVPSERPGSPDLESLESYKLFVIRAQMADASWMPEANSESSFRRILQLTDGIPLAIEIIAAWAPIASLAQICEDLTLSPLGSITEVDEFSSVTSERHRSMLHCFEWSFRQLSLTSPNDAAGFVRLGVFAGRFTEEAVRNVCEVNAPRELLSHLVKMSLVHPCPGTDPRRYSMLGFTRVLAQEKARSSGIAQNLIARHVDFFFHLASPSIEERQQVPVLLTSPEEDWPDLLAAADAASRIGNLPAVWRISRALSAFLQHRGLWSERERLNRAAVKAASDANYWVALERSLLELGSILEAQGHWAEAAKQYRRSLYFANRNASPNPNHQARALQHLGAVLARMGDGAGAERASKRLSEITPLLEQPKAKARSLDEEGKLFQDRGDLTNAELKYREAFHIRESMADVEGLARSRMNIGVIRTFRRDWKSAENELRLSLDFWLTQKTAHEQGIVLHFLADLFRRQGRYPEALDYCNRSIRCREDDLKGRAVTLSLLAKILRIQGDFEVAVVTLQEARELSRKINDPEGESIALDEIGTTYGSLRRWNEALIAFDKSRRLKESSTRRDIVGLGVTMDRIAQIHAKCGDWGKAQEAYTASLRFSREAGQKVTTAVTLTNVAMMNAAQGQKETALKALDDAITSLESGHSGKAVLYEAKKLRFRLNQKMRDGTPWIYWQEATFKNQSISIRKQFDAARKAERWKEAAAGYEALAVDYSHSEQKMEAALALNELGGVYRRLQDFTRAQRAIQKALSIFKEIGLFIGQAQSWHKLGDLFTDQHQWSSAEGAYAESIKLKLECSEEEGEAISQDALAKLLINAGRVADAERAANRAWEILSESGTTWQKWHPLVHMLWIKVENDDLMGAQTITECLTEAVRGNHKLETAAGELRAMTQACDWNGVRDRLAREGIIGLAETHRRLKPQNGDSVQAVVRTAARTESNNVLVVATEWNSKHGGLSSFNRDLCAALAAVGSRVVCYVPQADGNEVERANAVHVQLVVAPRIAETQGVELLLQPPSLPFGFVPDIVIGHDRITGAASVALARDYYSSSKRVIFIHTSPEEIEWHKEVREDSTSAERAAARKREQLGLAEQCDVVVAVGPRLATKFGTDLFALSNPPSLIELTPGLPEGYSRGPVLPPAIRCLILGRAEDYKLKGLDIAARALGRVVGKWRGDDPPSLIVRGAPFGTGDDLRRRLIQDGKPSLRDVVVRHYTSEETEIQSDLREASLVLMPSQREGFGLVGLEAIACGVPILISDQSGLALTLRHLVPDIAEEWIVPVEDNCTAEWEHRIKTFLQGRSGAFDRAATLREQLAAKLNWNRSATELLKRLAISRT